MHSPLACVDQQGQAGRVQRCPGQDALPGTFPRLCQDHLTRVFTRAFEPGELRIRMPWGGGWRRREPCRTPPVHFCREFAAGPRTRPSRVRAVLRAGTRLRRVCTVARNSGQVSTGRRLGGTRPPPVRGRPANSPLMCTGGTPRRYTCGRNARDPANSRPTCAIRIPTMAGTRPCVPENANSGQTCTMWN